MASRSAVPPQSATAYATAAQVAKTPGLRTEELASLMNWTPRHMTKALTGAKHGGLIGYLRQSGVARWFPAEQMAQAKATFAAQAKERERRHKRASNERQAIKRIDKAAQESRYLSEKPQITHGIAGAPLPFKCRAVSSVFHLGSMP